MLYSLRNTILSHFYGFPMTWSSLAVYDRFGKAMVKEKVPFRH
jgi:hypothetical protein